MVSYLNDKLDLERTKSIDGEMVKSGAKSPVDEETIALAYCLALEGKKTNILTRDGDHTNLLMGCSAIIGCDCFMPKNNLFRETLRKNPIQVYWRFLDSSKCKLEVDTREILFKDKFRLMNVYDKNTKEIQQKLGEFINQYFLINQSM